jgi:hypothetical protein
VHGERDDHPLAAWRGLVPAAAAPGGREDARALRVEEAPRLLAGAVEDLARVQGRGDGADRVDERLQEGGLSLELVLGGLVAPALGDDQIEREAAEEGRRGDQPARGDRSLANASPSAPTSAAPTVQATRIPRALLETQARTLTPERHGASRL